MGKLLDNWNNLKKKLNSSNETTTDLKVIFGDIGDQLEKMDRGLRKGILGEVKNNGMVEEKISEDERKDKYPSSETEQK
jgi:hypothetical protein